MHTTGFVHGSGSKRNRGGGGPVNIQHSKTTDAWLTSLSGFGAHSSDNSGDLDIIVPYVWISGWCVQTLKTERKGTVKEECQWSWSKFRWLICHATIVYPPPLTAELCDNSNNRCRVEDLSNWIILLPFCSNTVTYSYKVVQTTHKHGPKVQCFC